MARLRWLAAVVAASVALAGIAPPVQSQLAESGSPQAAPSLLASHAALAELQRQAVEAAGERRRHRDSAAQREQRRQTRSMFRSLPDATAVGVIQEFFPALVDEPWAPYRLRPGQRVVRRVNDEVSVLGGSASANEIAISSVPQVTDSGDPLDLSLAAGSAGGFAPRNPHVPVRFDATLGGGFELRSQSLKLLPLVDNPGAAVSVVAGAAVYPNSDIDSDVIVRPKPYGFETHTQLRSPLSPEVVRFEIQGPGLELARSTSSGRSADVMRGGRRVASIGSVVAFDADHEPVEVEARVDGEIMSVRVRHREADYRYPIVVDPDVVDTDFSGPPSPYWGGFWNFQYYQGTLFAPWGGAAHLGDGLYIRHEGGWYNDADRAEWYYVAPGDARVTRFDLAKIQNNSAPGTSMCAYGGILNAGGGWDSGPRWVCGDQENSGPLGFGTASTAPRNLAVYGIGAAGSAWRPYWESAADRPTVYLTDNSAPRLMSANTAPTGWTNAGSTPVTATFHDDGLGIRAAEFFVDNGTSFGVTVHSAAARCDLDSRTGARIRCPLDHGVSTTFDQVNEGETIMRARGIDLTEKATVGGGWTVRYDATGPETAVSGGLRRAAGQTIYGGPYPLRVSASDGARVRTPRAGVRSLEILASRNGGPFVREDYAEQPYQGDSQPLGRDWGFFPARRDPGNYVVRVITTDFANNTTTVDTSVTVARPPAAENDQHYVFGVARQRERLLAVVPPTYGSDLTYQWQSCASSGSPCDDIPGATEDFLDLRSQDIGRRIRVRVRRADGADRQSALTGDVQALAPTVDGPPGIVGRQTPGETLEAAADGAFGGSPPTGYAYQWQRCDRTTDTCFDISGATGAAYQLRASDKNSRFRVRVTAINSAGQATAPSNRTNIIGQVETGGTDDTTPDEADPTSAERRTAARDFRLAHGMRADDAYLDGLEADPALSRTTRDWGLALTALEERDLELRNEVNDGTAVIEQFGRTSAPATYAGVFTDHARGGLIVARFLQGAVIDEAALRARFPHVTRLRIERDATFTLTALEGLRQRVIGDLATLRAEGIVVKMLQVDEQANRLNVGVATPTSAIASALASRYGTGIRLVEDAGVTRVVAHRAKRYRPLRGGIRIESGQRCTLGFLGSILNADGGAPVRTRALVTAGHCSGAYTTYKPGRQNAGPTHHQQETWFQANEFIARTSKSTVNTAIKAQDIGTNRRTTDAVTMIVDDPDDMRNYIYTSRTSTRRVTSKDDTYTDKVGDTVVISRGFGPGDRNIAGIVVDREYVDDSESPPYPEVYESRVVDRSASPRTCIGGDSGSPVYTTKDHGEAEAVGMVFASRKSDGRCVYAHIENIARETGFRPWITSVGPGAS
jgi:hypothetical protein